MYDVEDVIGEEEKALVRLTIRGAHRGELMRISPTGREVEVGVLDLFRLADGKLVEHWAAIDNLGLMRQLGAIAEPGQSQESG